jgi:hypothetical protein
MDGCYFRGFENSHWKRALERKKMNTEGMEVGGTEFVGEGNSRVQTGVSVPRWGQTQEKGHRASFGAK